MNTTAVHIDTRLYNNAAEYARRKHTNVGSLLEAYITTLLTTSQQPSGKKKYSKLSPVVQRLGSLNLREFTKEEIEEDPRLAYLLEEEQDA